MTRKKPTPEPKRPVGRPPFKIDLDQLAKLASIGCTKEEAAFVLGCGKRTLLDHMRAENEVTEAWERGVNLGKVSLRRLQWRHANGSGSSAVNMTIHLSKHRLGETDKAAIEMSGPNGNPIPVVFSKDDAGLL
ncbi:hypothetical protein [Bradyrhizobium denitrificans]|uniref:hypothetical protein n=1 Tax=Bradyrhizobium denitrificans TaxID=2734912 RepID=UPI0015571F38|nr:hypothetical protein [Bradyrhizobium sp. LMG 8443]NPU23954.1 hypothetical protein [Bradyrhizobium sp. LMG 8443]